jgi:DNA-directed RNA polymerase subunit N (RpoN/RPB10)
MTGLTPFRVRCLSCGTIAESWHWTDTLPEGQTDGPARCECEKVMADSTGVPKRGRIVTNLPVNMWEVID